VLLLGHLDTVWPVGELERQPLRRDGNLLYGPGVYDMKAGLAIGLLAVRALLEQGSLPGTIVVLVTSDEETGSRTSRRVIEDEARRSQAVLVLEPALPGGAVKTRRKGCGEFRLAVRGRAAHAGIEPERGASATLELAHQILAIQHLQDPAADTTVNIGVVRGGSRPNVVAAEAEAVIDVRVASRTEELRLAAALHNLRPVVPGTLLEISGGFDRPPLERTPEIGRLFNLAGEVASALGRQLEEGGTGGGSDGNFTAALGVPTLDGLGAIGSGAHAFGEHIDVSEIAWRAALVAGVVERVLTR
jgi:glutamate carboxypeptidase